MHCATFYKNSLCHFWAVRQDKLSTAGWEVSPNLRHEGVQSFRWVRWLTWGLDLKSLWLVQALKSICSSTRKHGGYTNSSLLEGAVIVRKYHAHAILKNLYELEMDVILTISFKITAEIEITKHMFCILLCRRGHVLAFCKA